MTHLISTVLKLAKITFHVRIMKKEIKFNKN